MSMRLMTCAVCLACAVYLLSEALPRPTPPPALSPAVTAQQPDDDERDRDERDDNDQDGGVLLEQAVKRWHAVNQLRVTIWQRMHGPNPFEAESRLILAPHGCARMEMKLRAGTEAVEQLVISDGRALATVQRRPGVEDKVRGQTLPVQRVRREQVLAASGCAGPGAILKQLRDGLAGWRARLAGGATLRLTGRVDAARPACSHLAALGAAVCTLDLDAATLWPRRIEWRGLDERRRPRLILEMEYRDPETERALSAEECARLFTYTP
jgi:hypothetical protein